MKDLKLFFTCVIAAAALTACSTDEKETTTKDDSYYAASASISSSDSRYSSTSGGGQINYAASGGDVVVNVSCGTDWTVAHKGVYWLNSNVDLASGTVTLTADQNTDEEQRDCTVTFSTATDGVQFATVTVTQNAYGAPEITLSQTEWNAPAAGALSVDIAVTATSDYSVGTATELWLKGEKTDTGVTLTVEANTEPVGRSAEITIAASDGIQTTSQTVTVTQDAHAYIDLGEDSVYLDQAGETHTLTIESNYDWTAGCEADWLTVSGSGSELTVTAKANDESGTRSTSVALTAGDGVENVTEAVLTVNQYAFSPLILEITTTAANKTVTLPLSGTVNCVVDWGDGSDAETVTSSDPDHVYETAGTYYASVTGTVTALYGAPTTVTGVEQWGRTGLTDMTSAFDWDNKLNHIPTDTEGSFSEVTSFEGAFYFTILTELPEGLFDYATKVTTFNSCFWGCTKLAAVPESLFANCLLVEDFEATFGNDYGIKTGESPYNVLSDGTKVHLYERENYPDIFTVPTSYDSCFSRTYFSDMDQIPSAWGGNGD